MKKSAKDNFKVITSNRRAHAKYTILETMEAGLVLTGPEVKSLRAGQANMSEGFIKIEKDEAFLWNVHIMPYSHGSTHVEQDPLRTRKVLLHRNEIDKWFNKAVAKGHTIVPLELYLSKSGKIKLKLGLAKGKLAPDRRDDIKKRTIQRELNRQFAGKTRIR